MAIEASAILPSDSLEELRVQFNNLVTDVDGITGGNSFVSSIIFEGSTADANETVLLATDPTADRVITIPDITGTLLTTGNASVGATTTTTGDVDHILVNDGGVLKKITSANLGVGGLATDIAARGIDVEDLSHVINYDLPNVSETYIHRIGRTGRASASGIALSFCDVEEKPYLRDIQKLIDQKIPVITDHPFEDTSPEVQSNKPSNQNKSQGKHNHNKNKRFYSKKRR